MHSATRRLISRFFIGGPSLSLGRKWSSGKNGCSYFLKYTPRGILSPFFKKKIEKKKKNQNAEVVASPDDCDRALPDTSDEVCGGVFFVELGACGAGAIVL